MNEEQLRAIARTHVGLIVGPAVTTSEPDVLLKLRDALAAAFGVSPTGTYRDTAEAAVAAGAELSRVRATIRSATQRAAASPGVRTLARVRWSAVLSLASDKHLEDALVARSAAALHGRDVSVISNLFDEAPPHTVPVFKLLGAYDRDDFVATPSDLLRRTPLWAKPVRAFLDAVKASPILCLGLADSDLAFEILSGHLFAGPSHRPARLVFLADDPILQNPRLSSLIPPGAGVIASCNLRDLCSAVEPAPRNLQLAIPFAKSKDAGRSLDLEGFASIFDAVPVSGLDASVPSSELARVLDYLFMPDVPNWEPYAAALDLPRSISAEVMASVKQMAADAEAAALVVLHGRAGSGKTVVMRRIAYDLATTGYVVGWLKRYWHTDASVLVDKLFHELRVLPTGTPLVLFADDPVRLGTIRLSDVLGAAERHEVRVVLVVGMRTSEYRQRDLSLLCEEMLQHELEDELDENESARLPGYVVSIGAFATPEEATSTLKGDKMYSGDTLAALYLLLPSTRQMLAASVQDEFLRFGEPGELERFVLGNVERSAKVLQDAYAMAAVSMQYGAPLPIEVLVRALGVSFAEWMEIISAPGPAWGILYPDDRSDLEGACYRPRNHLVTGFVIRLINGGTMTRDGEVGVLRRLLAACDGSSGVYRSFCRSILATRDKLTGLTAAQGLELYDSAINALPREDSVLLHHKGIWLRKTCDDPDRAIVQFNRALSAQSGSTDPEEPPQLIQTSIAAALFQKIERNTLSLDEGKAAILRELEQSKDIQFINANSAHLFAHTMSKLAGKHSEDAGADRASLLNLAVSEIDRTLLLLRNSRTRADRLAKDVAMLQEERDRILLEEGNVAQLDARAVELWGNHKSQAGFALAIRKRTSEILGQADKGSKYHEAFTHWQRYCDLVGGVDALSPELAEVGLTLYYEWQIRPRSVQEKEAGTGGLKWDLLEKTAKAALASDRYRNDPLYTYIRALALAHLDRWDEAELLFGRIRRLKMRPAMLHHARDYLLAPYGTPRKVQGKIKPGASQTYFSAADIIRTFPADLSSPWGTQDVHHAFIVFSFAGPKATLDAHRVPGV